MRQKQRYHICKSKFDIHTGNCRGEEVNAPWRSYITQQKRSLRCMMYRYLIDDFEADMKLHSLVLKEINVKMYSSELYDDYMSVVNAIDKKPVEEQNVNYYNNEKRWNRSR